MPGNAPVQPCDYFFERLNLRLAISHSSGRRARSGMRFTFVSFHFCRVGLCRLELAGRRSVVIGIGVGSSLQKTNI